MVYLLTQTIKASAQKFPNKDAFVCGNRSITYSALEEQTQRIACFLYDSGVKKGDRVGIYLNRCLETALAIYGIMKAGAVYVPLDPGAPSSRNQFLIDDCDIQHVISHPLLEKQLLKVIAGKTSLKTIIGLKQHEQIKTISWDAISEFPLDPGFSVNILADDLAYIIYTSGSTGTPKGIMHTHYSGLSYAKLSAALYGLEEKDKFGNHSPIHFDISTLGYFTAPLVGATTVIITEAYIKMPSSLSALIQNQEISIWYSVPLALIQLVQNGAINQRDLSCLRWVLFAGEPFPAKHLRDLMISLPDAKFSNIYGPAELNQCTFYNVPSFPAIDESIPLGQVWGNTEMMIVDESDQEVPKGAVGELLVRSATMMKGYWKRPELTSKSLFTRETTPDVKQTYYRTGDLVKIDETGSLIFLGRKDRQVKIRGYRVELDEVSTAILGHEDIEEVAVFPIKDDSGISHVIAHAIVKPEHSITTDGLSDYLSVRLPKYALPSKILFVGTLPRISTGKIDYRKLQETALNQ